MSRANLARHGGLLGSALSACTHTIFPKSQARLSRMVLWCHTSPMCARGPLQLSAVLKGRSENPGRHDNPSRNQPHLLVSTSRSLPAVMCERHDAYFLSAHGVTRRKRITRKVHGRCCRATDDGVSSRVCLVFAHVVRTRTASLRSNVLPKWGRSAESNCEEGQVPGCLSLGVI